MHVLVTGTFGCEILTEVDEVVSTGSVVATNLEEYDSHLTRFGDPLACLNEFIANLIRLWIRPGLAVCDHYNQERFVRWFIVIEKIIRSLREGFIQSRSENKAVVVEYVDNVFG